MKKAIPGYPGYTIDVHGEIISLQRKKPVKHEICHDGYPMVRLTYSEGRKRKTVHRLLAETFLPRPEGATQVNHKNGDRADFSLGNLEWVTMSENVRHSYDTLNRVNHRRKLTSAQVHCIFSLKNAGVSSYKIAKFFHMSAPGISYILSGKTYAKEGRVLCKQFPTGN